MLHAMLRCVVDMIGGLKLTLILPYILCVMLQGTLNVYTVELIWQCGNAACSLVTHIDHIHTYIALR